MLQKMVFQVSTIIDTKIVLINSNLRFLIPKVKLIK